MSLTQVGPYILYLQDFHLSKKKVREKSRECHKFDKGLYKQVRKNKLITGHNSRVSGSIYPNVNQVIYFSLTIDSLGFTAAAPIVFLDIVLTCFHPYIL